MLDLVIGKRAIVIIVDIPSPLYKKFAPFPLENIFLIKLIQLAIDF